MRISDWSSDVCSSDLASEAAVLALAGNANRFTQGIPQLQAQLDEVVRAMSSSGSPSSQIYIALRQNVLAGNLARRVTQVRSEARRVGKEGVSTCIYRWSPDH